MAPSTTKKPTPPPVDQVMWSTLFAFVGSEEARKTADIRVNDMGKVYEKACAVLIGKLDLLQADLDAKLDEVIGGTDGE